MNFRFEPEARKAEGGHGIVLLLMLGWFDYEHDTEQEHETSLGCGLRAARDSLKGQTRCEQVRFWESPSVS
jgi:hypothetical protein